MTEEIKPLSDSPSIDALSFAFETDMKTEDMDMDMDMMDMDMMDMNNEGQGYAYNNMSKIPYHDPSSPHYTLFSKFLPYFLLYRCFPPNTPRSTQLLRKENLAIPMCYLTVGLLQGLSGPFINVYPLFLNATEAQQVTISGIRSLPALFKLGFGFWSDNVLLFGYRRKSYMFVGWMMSSLAMLSLLLCSDLSRIPVDVDGDGDESASSSSSSLNGNYVPAENAPSIVFLSFVLLMFGTGFWFADVMGDSLVAEKAKLEPEQTRGHLQSTCYSCRFFGLMIAAPISTVIYSTFGPKIVVVSMTIIPMIMLPFIYNLWEVRDIEIKSTKDQCHEIWNTVCSRAVWQPMGFVYVYNLLQVGNAAWKEYLRSVLNFTDAQLNIFLIVAYVLLYVGVLAYKYYFIKWSWRSIYVMSTILNTVLSSLQVLLIQGITFGLSPFVFALGDDIFADFIAGIQFLPTTIMMVHLCPAGSEGASYAMFTTVSNCASGLSSALSTILLKIWDVSKETMVGGDLSGMTKLTILTTVLQTSGLLFVKFLPNTKDDLNKLHTGQYSGSRIGGFIFLSITLSSIVYAIVIGLMNIINGGAS